MSIELAASSLPDEAVSTETHALPMWPILYSGALTVLSLCGLAIYVFMASAT